MKGVKLIVDKLLPPMTMVVSPDIYALFAKDPKTAEEILQKEHWGVEGALGTDTGFGTKEPIQSNGLPMCINCGLHITEESDSGWEGFTEDGRTTQPICKGCDKIQSKGGNKAQ